MSSADAGRDDQRYRSEIESIPGVREPWREDFRRLAAELREAVPFLLPLLTSEETDPDPGKQWESVRPVLGLISKWEEQLQIALDDIRQAKAKWDSESALRSKDVDLMTASVKAQRQKSTELEKQISDWGTQIESSKTNLAAVQQDLTRRENLLQTKLTELQTVEQKIRDSEESWSDKEKKLQQQNNELASETAILLKQKTSLSQQKLEAQLFTESVLARETQADKLEARLEDSRRANETQKHKLVESRKLLDEDRRHLDDSRQANKTQEREMAESRRRLDGDRLDLEDERSQLEDRERELEVREAAYETSNANLQEDREALDELIQDLRDEERNLSNLRVSLGAVVDEDPPEGIQDLLSEIIDHVLNLVEVLSNIHTEQRRRADDISVQRDETEAQLAAYLEDNDHLRQELEQTETTVRERDQTISGLRDKVLELEYKDKTLHVEIEDLNVQNTKQEEETLILEERISSLTNAHATLVQVHENSLSEEVKYKENITTLEGDNLRLQQGMKSLQEKFATLQIRLGENEQNIRQVTEDRERLQQQSEESIARITVLQGSIAAAERQSTERSKHVQALEDKLEKALVMQTDAVEEVNKLRHAEETQYHTANQELRRQLSETQLRLKNVNAKVFIHEASSSQDKQKIQSLQRELSESRKMEAKYKGESRKDDASRSREIKGLKDRIELLELENVDLQNDVDKNQK